jgi:hypothetical protein
MKAKLGSNKTLFFFDAGAVVVNPSLLTAQVKSGATVVATLTFSATAGVPNLYRSSNLLISKVGQYEVVFLYNGTAQQSDYLEVDMNPTTDYPVGQSVNLKLPNTGIGTGATVTAQVVTAAGTVGNSIAAPYSSGVAAYQAPTTFSVAGDYCVIWYQAVNNVPTPIKAESLYVVVPTGREKVSFVAGDGANPNASVPYVSAKLVISDTEGTWVAQTVTNAGGQAVIELPPGTYRATLVKSPYVYSINNFTFTVNTTTTNQTIQLNTGALSVTVSPEQQVAPVCRLYADLYRMTGQPLTNAVVRVALVSRPQLFSGTPVMDTDLIFHTDDHGHVEFDLVQGVQIEVSVAPLSLRRIVTVPSGQNAVEPVNLMTLMASAPDLFDIIAPQLPAAAKRSL